jgi:hypothetical protein
MVWLGFAWRFLRMCVRLKDPSFGHHDIAAVAREKGSSSVDRALPCSVGGFLNEFAHA